MTKAEIATESLDRAQNGKSLSNYAAIYDGFAALGIAASDVTPRVNVLTYFAWSAKGRAVKEEERQNGVIIPTMRTNKSVDKETGEEVVRRARTTATVYHISQTELAA